MKIRDWAKNTFSLGSKIAWPCPNCHNSSLYINNDKFCFEQTAESKELSKDADWEIEWVQLTFSGVLNCRSCHEFVAVSGTGTIKDFEYYDQFTGEYDCERFEIFTPVFFYPPLPIFRIPEKCPPIVKEDIVLSFKLFWVDLSSCANKIRTAIEVLLNQQKIKKSIIRNKKRRRLNLHDRIIEFQKKNGQVAECLLAIKWIGNTGSHVGELSQADILDAYELLDFSLHKLYDNNEKELEKMKREINKRKGTRKK